MLFQSECHLPHGLAGIDLDHRLDPKGTRRIFVHHRINPERTPVLQRGKRLLQAGLQPVDQLVQDAIPIGQEKALHLRGNACKGPADDRSRVATAGAYQLPCPAEETPRFTVPLQANVEPALQFRLHDARALLLEQRSQAIAITTGGNAHAGEPALAASRGPEIRLE